MGRRSSAESKMTTPCLIEMARPHFSSTSIDISTSDNPPHTTYSLSSVFSSLLTLFPHSRYPSLQLSSSIGTNILCIAWSAFFGLAALRQGARRCFFPHIFFIIPYVEVFIILYSQIFAYPHAYCHTFSLSLPDAYVTSHSVAYQIGDSFTYFSPCFVRIGLLIID